MSVASVSLFLDTLVVADRQIDTTRRHTRVADLVLGLPGVAEMVLLFLLRRQALIFRKDAIVLKGVAANVAETRANCLPGDLPPDNKKVQIEGLQRLGEIVKRLHHHALEVGSKSTRVQSAARSFAATAADLYETITELRWEFMELEASMSKCGDGYVASNSEELDTLFERITHE